MYKLQLRHQIPALNARASRAYYTTARPIAQQILDMDAGMTSKMNVALIIKQHGSLLCLDYFFWTCHPWVFVQPGIGRRPVDWCRN